MSRTVNSRAMRKNDSWVCTTCVVVDFFVLFFLLSGFEFYGDRNKGVGWRSVATETSWEN